jgi:hypothetical protein
MSKPFAFFIHRFQRYFFIKASLILDGGKYIFDLFPKPRCATFNSPGAISERSGHFFNSVVAIPRSTVPSALKAAEFSVSAFQQSQHCYNF